MATIAERIREALEIRGMKQSDLVKMTGIGKSSISTYLSGAYLPKQQNLYKIAKALSVRESWLLGEDVEMELGFVNNDLSERDIEIIKERYGVEISKELRRIGDNYRYLSGFSEFDKERIKDLTIYYNILNPNGQDAIIEIIQLLLALNIDGQNEVVKRIREMTHLDMYLNEEAKSFKKSKSQKSTSDIDDK